MLLNWLFVIKLSIETYILPAIANYHSTLLLLFSLKLWFLLDQESIVRVPMTRVSAAGEKQLISDSFLLYRIFKNLFLPQGYPDSVSEDYINYQLWDTIQAFCSTINGMSNDVFILMYLYSMLFHECIAYSSHFFKVLYQLMLF